MAKSIKELEKEFSAAIKGRNKHTGTVTVIELPSDEIPEITYWPKGIAIGISADPQSNYLQQLTAAFEKKKYTEVFKLVKKHLDQVSKLGKKYLYPKLKDAPSLGQIEYDGKVLMKGFMSGNKLNQVFAMVPYNGASLSKSKFKYIEFNNADNAQLNTLIIIRKPQLSLIEKDIIRQTQNDTKLTFGKGGSVYFTPLAVAVVAVAEAGIAVGAVVYCTATRYHRPEFVSQELKYTRGAIDVISSYATKAIDARLSATKLMQLRENVIIDVASNLRN